ncbi:uncharacterized protein LOC141901424 [Tubulanus polymorphus]|uniref:uncharacterized protein LOC141901424 n=1 Tax=Tubulanus polymorphus TaxID=672921 RepID=UPI003DA615B1
MSSDPVKSKTLQQGPEEPKQQDLEEPQQQDLEEPQLRPEEPQLRLEESQLNDLEEPGLEKPKMGFDIEESKLGAVNNETSESNIKTCDNNINNDPSMIDNSDNNKTEEIPSNNNSSLNINTSCNEEIIDLTAAAGAGAAAAGVLRPESLTLPTPLQHSASDSSSFEELEVESPSVSLERLESVIQAVTEIPLHEQGVLLKDGKMMSFVAEDLNEMIRMSSPLSRSSRTNSIRSISSVNSISSSSYCSTSVSGMSRSSSLPLHPSPDEIPPIDPHALKDIETHAKRVADNLDLMMGNLKATLHKMSAITISCGDAYSNGVDNTCESVDTCIKSMYALMAKCEEMSKVMQPVYKVAEQIKEIKRLLDLFESQMAKDKEDKLAKVKK